MKKIILALLVLVFLDSTAFAQIIPPTIVSLIIEYSNGNQETPTVYLQNRFRLLESIKQEFCTNQDQEIRPRRVLEQQWIHSETSIPFKGSLQTLSQTESEEIWSAASQSCAAYTIQADPPHIRHDGDRLIVHHTTFNDLPVEFIFDQGSQDIRFCVTSYHDDKTGGRFDKHGATVFLRDQVLRIKRNQNPIKLGSSSVFFEFIGKHLIWAPLVTVGPGYEAQCLIFAENGTTTENRIIGHGAKKPPRWNGYLLYGR